MKNKGSLKNVGNVLGIVSLSIALVMPFLILNHFLKQHHIKTRMAILSGNIFYNSHRI